jgi:hypothetical protein
MILERGRRVLAQGHRASEGCVLPGLRLLGPLDPSAQVHEPLLVCVQGVPLGVVVVGLLPRGQRAAHKDWGHPLPHTGLRGARGRPWCRLGGGGGVSIGAVAGPLSGRSWLRNRVDCVSANRVPLDPRGDTSWGTCVCADLSSGCPVG